MIRDLLCKRIYQICIIQNRQPYDKKSPTLRKARDYCTKAILVINDALRSSAAGEPSPPAGA